MICIRVIQTHPYKNSISLIVIIRLYISLFATTHDLLVFIHGQAMRLFMKYSQIARLNFGQVGQWMGTFEHGDEDVDFPKLESERPLH